MAAMWSRLEDLHGRMITPDLAVDAQGVIATWKESGEVCRMRLYAGDDIRGAYDTAFQSNLDLEAYFRDQQRNEQAAEAAATRFYEEGHGEYAFRLEDEERRRGHTLH